MYYLSKNKSSDSQRCTEQGGNHQKFEAINNTFVMQTTCAAHGWQGSSFNTDICENLPYYVTQK